jgi:tetratricopeptide (TPR) repeat protein
MSIIECGICVDFLSQATETACCHKLFCRDCIAGWLGQRSNCPICRAALRPDMLSPNVVLQRFVDGMTVDCPNRCPQKPARSDLESHLRVCELRPELVAQQRQERQAALASRVASAKGGRLTAVELLALSRDLLSCNDYPNAQFAAEEAIQKGGGAEASEQLGDTLFASGSWKVALDTFPGSCGAKRAECQIKLGLYSEAEASLKSLLLNDAGAAKVLGKLGELKKKTSSYSEAAQYLNDGLRLVEKNSAQWIELSLSLADVLRKTERYEESQKLYIVVLKASEKLFGRKSNQAGNQKKKNRFFF